MLATNNDSICVLLAVWGEKFIKDFLRFSLPTLLASGNLPALGRDYPLKFIFLTKRSHTKFFQKHLIYKKLLSICEVKFIFIDDLITYSNYSTTLTLAYDRGIKHTGDKMLNTYFIFLTSDYIMANNSMEGLLRYIKKGYSGICAGNFQVNEAQMSSFLRKYMSSGEQVMTIPARELMKYSLKCLHPIVIASMVDLNIAHNYYANRFYLRCGSHTLAGRFYLLHMLCIKPEVMNYKVGASCDYSFIPEMCPSGNIGIINDSDDYFVVEMQSKNHELNYILSGQYNDKKLTRALAQWTTYQHRENAKHTIYFHYKDLTDNDKIMIEQKFDDFVNVRLGGLNKYSPKPFYNHPYWIGAIQAHENEKAIISKIKDYEYVDTHIISNQPLKKMYHRVYGTPPHVYPWHYGWSEFRSVMNAFKTQMATLNPNDVIVFYDSYYSCFMRYCSWLKNSLFLPYHYYIRNLLASKKKLKELQTKKFSLAILMLELEMLENIAPYLMSIKKCLNKSGKLVIYIPNTKNYHSRYVFDFLGEIILRLHQVTKAEYDITQVHIVYDNLAFLSTLVIDRVRRVFANNYKMKLLIYSLCAIPALFISLWNNMFSCLYKKKSGHCANVILTVSPRVFNE